MFFFLGGGNQRDTNRFSGSALFSGTLAGFAETARGAARRAPAARGPRGGKFWHTAQGAVQRPAGLSYAGWSVVPRPIGSACFELCLLLVCCCWSVCVLLLALFPACLLSWVCSLSVRCCLCAVVCWWCVGVGAWWLFECLLV